MLKYTFGKHINELSATLKKMTAMQHQTDRQKNE